MSTDDGSRVDLDLLRVLVAVEDAGGVTAAARRLYLTQSAVSAAIKRLSEAVGAPLLARSGRGVVLTARGRRLASDARPHLDALLRAVLAPADEDPRRVARVLRLGLGDGIEPWLLAPLAKRLAREAPGIRLVVLPVQFRTVGDALVRGSVELAVSVADELPAGIDRRPLARGDFVCLLDPRHVRSGGRWTPARYLAHEHVVVSYNGDTRGIVEDLLGMERRVRCSVPSFHAVGVLVEGSDLLATIPRRLAAVLTARHPGLAVVELPFALPSAAIELLWRSAVRDDPAVRLLVEMIEALVSETDAAVNRRRARGSASGASRRRGPRRAPSPRGGR
jgi:LysR family transcriptional activator of mexEF-oprN operon